MARPPGLSSDEFRDESIWDKLVEADHARLNEYLKQPHFSGDPPNRKIEGPAARILPADDNPTNQAVALAQLEKLGYKADAVATGVEVIEALEHRRYDLILMDSEIENAASEQHTAIFHSDAYLKRLMGDRQLAGKILNGFLSDVPSQLDNLQKRFDEADHAGARMQAHTLKGSAATISAGGLRAISQEMEHAPAAADLDHFGRLLPRALEEFEELKRTLEKGGWL